MIGRIQLLVCVICILNIDVLQAQSTFSVKGNLRDQQNEPVPFANVALYDVSDKLITGVPSDINGDFLISGITEGSYKIEVQFVGYETWSRSDILINKDINLGTLLINESSKVLNEVVIRGEVMERPFEVSAEGLTINPSQNLSNIGGSVLDILRNTPSINVDGEGAISLRGSSSTNILINGRNSSLSANLDQIPASAIKSIKVINNPGAKYDADAKGGIINIELKKGEGLGTHGNLDLSYGTGDRYNGSVKVSHQTKDYLVYGGYDIRQWIGRGTFTGFRETSDENERVLQQQGDIKRRGLNQNFKYGADYFFGNNQLTYEGLYRKGIDRDREHRLSDFQHDGMLETTNRYNYETEDGYAIDNALIYERTFKKEDQSFKAQVSHSSRTNMEVQTIESTIVPNNGNTIGQQRGSNDEGRTISIFQADYVHPFSNDNRLETGFKTVLRNFDNDYTFEVYNPSEVAWAEDPDISNRFLYEEQVHAFYVSYHQKFEKLNFSVGNRFEKAIINTTQYALNEKNRLSYLNLFPSANLQYHISKKQDLRFSYSRRIDRPRAGRLNPFPDISDSLNIRSGNPMLQPEYIQSLELGQHVTFKKFDLTTTLFYRYITGMIDYIITVDESGISYGRPENLNSGYDVGLELIGTTRLAPWWDMNLSYSIFQRTVDGSNINQNFTNENIAWNTKVVSDFTLPLAIKLQVNFNYESAEVEAQGEDFARYATDASIMKTFNDEKIRVGISVRDIFNTRRYGGTSFGDGFYQERVFKPESRLVFFSFGMKI
jgi:outer membrane receptor protein involved in Fe transport